MQYFVSPNPVAFCQEVLALRHEGKVFFPIIQHLTLDQDRAIGDKNTFKPHRHPFFHLVLSTSGHGEFLTSEGLVEVIPGDLVCISPGELHDFISDRNNIVYCEITFSLQSSDGSFYTGGLDKVLHGYWGLSVNEVDKHYHCQPFQVQRCRDHLETLYALLNVGYEWKGPQLHKAFLDLLYFFVEISEESSQGQGPERSNVDRAKAWLDSNYQEEFRVEELAKEIGLSRAQFFKGFKKKFNTSPLAYQQCLRVSAAKNLLESSDLYIREIGQKVGYTNDQLFFRDFKKLMGTTPKRYRDNFFRMTMA
jgi:AraC-like DNA-binding protein/mannose-6-phosphate isomerase-like protein (cupin superfamily)